KVFSRTRNDFFPGSGRTPRALFGVFTKKLNRDHDLATADSNRSLANTASAAREPRCAVQCMRSRADLVRVEDLTVWAFTIPTETPEADGTYEWDSTTIVIVSVAAGASRGLGYTYADAATAKLIHDKLKNIVI